MGNIKLECVKPSQNSFETSWEFKVARPLRFRLLNTTDGTLIIFTFISL